MSAMVNNTVTRDSRVITTGGEPPSGKPETHETNAESKAKRHPAVRGRGQCAGVEEARDGKGGDGAEGEEGGGG